jgi:hypothetical protein
MGKTSIVCVILVFALLLEDGSSVKKKSEEEKREDEKIAEMVNITLAEEEAEKNKEEAEKKKRDHQEKGKKTKAQDEKKRDEDVKGKDKDAACSSLNFTCPEVQDCPECPSVRCDPCPETKDCGVCPEVKPCRPCHPCPVFNNTRRDQECPSPPSCMESPGMSVPVAMVVGASISLVTMGAAAVVGLILRYVPPLVSGILFLSVVLAVWFLSSHYPDVARDMGGRVATILREATVALGHRVMAAIQRQQEQVGFPVNSTRLKIEFQVSKVIFHFRKVCTKISYVEKINFLVNSEGHARFEIHAEKFRMQHFS